MANRAGVIFPKISYPSIFVVVYLDLLMHFDSSAIRVDDLFTLRWLMLLNLVSTLEASCFHLPSGSMFFAAIIQGEGQHGKRMDGGCHLVLSLAPVEDERQS